MEYKNDKSEFMAFVEAGLDNNKSASIDICLERVTKAVDEEFLVARAEQYKTDVKTDKEFKETFKKLAVICNKKEQNCIKCPVCKYCNTYIENARKGVSDASLKMIEIGRASCRERV